MPSLEWCCYLIDPDEDDPLWAVAARDGERYNTTISILDADTQAPLLQALQQGFPLSELDRCLIANLRDMGFEPSEAIEVVASYRFTEPLDLSDEITRVPAQDPFAFTALPAIGEMRYGKRLHLCVVVADDEDYRHVVTLDEFEMSTGPMNGMCVMPFTSLVLPHAAVAPVARGNRH